MEWISGNLQYILLALLGIFFNVMDSVTTHIGLNRLPEDIKAVEGNPIAVLAFKRKSTSVLFEICKQALVIGLVGFYVYNQYSYGLVMIAVLFGLVVINNTVTIVMRIITKRRHKSPLFWVASVLRIPKVLSYPFTAILLLAIALWVPRIFGLHG